MSKPSAIVILVEDQLTQSFVRKYIKRLGLIGSPPVRTVALPAGRGSGEQYVREKYAAEVKAFRARNAKATTWLVVAVDADRNDVAYRARQLAQELTNRGMSHRGDNEAIVHLIPKRNIETWILCLTGAAVDEETDYSNDERVSERLPTASEMLFNWSRPNAAPSALFIPSLHTAIPELRRLEH